ncbi:MAG: hypothetical protein KDC93_11685 [Cyclobacteriaceae bacterium]|nr:hypothetical protein [Cyclobacteriaceae bacterium]
MNSLRLWLGSGRVYLLFFLIFCFCFSSCKKDDPSPPIKISFSAVTQSVVEGNVINMVFSMERAASQSGTVKVKLGGTAVYTEDYNTNPSGNSGAFEVVIAAGATTFEFSIATVNNSIYQGDKTVTFTLADPSDGFILDNKKEFTLTITDDESQAIANFTSIVASLSESSANGIVIEIPFSVPTKGPGSISVSWGSINASYSNHFTTLPEANANTIILSVPDNASAASLTLIPIDDSFFHENYKVVLEITATAGSVRSGANNKLTVTILEDEFPSIASFSTTDGMIAENEAGGIVVPIALSIPASETGSMTISFMATPAVYGTHFTTQPAASASNIVINVAKGSNSAELTIFPIDNGVDDENLVIFFSVSSGTGVIRPGGNINYVLTIKDDDPTLRKVLISFGGAGAPQVQGTEQWNHAYTNTPDAGASWSNLSRADAVTTTIDLGIDLPLSPQPLGKTTGINSGVFPDNALKEYWYVPGPAQGITRGFSLYQLNNATEYTIRIHGGTTVLAAGGVNTMTISINGIQKSINDVTNNTTQVLEWININPVASIFNVELTDTDGGGICMINAMEISWYED